jgi:hypothetical protein
LEKRSNVRGKKESNRGECVFFISWRRHGQGAVDFDASPKGHMGQVHSDFEFGTHGVDDLDNFEHSEERWREAEEQAFIASSSSERHSRQ